MRLLDTDAIGPMSGCRRRAFPTASRVRPARPPRIEALQFRANAFRAAALVLGALGLVAVLGAAGGRALAALPAAASATERVRLEQVRNSLDALTRARYLADANLDDRGPIDEAVTTARTLAREGACERRWSPRDWFGAAAPAPQAPGA